MTKPTPTYGQTRHTRKLMSVICALVLTGLLGGCDGGLFGTGDGSDVIVTGDAAAPSDQAPPGTTTPLPDETDPVNGIGSSQQTLPITFAFSNTNPSGLASATTQLPAVKLINLLDESVTAAVEGGTSLTVPPFSASTLLGVNTGEALVSFSQTDAGTDGELASINPLNSSAQSLTSVVLSRQEADSTEQQPESAMLNLSVLALSTRTAVSAPGMAEVRVIVAATHSSTDEQPQITLQSQDSSSAGADVVFTQFFDENGPRESYSLANAGRYLLRTSDDSFAPQVIELRGDEVYTLIITNDRQAPVFLEVDSLVD